MDKHTLITPIAIILLFRIKKISGKDYVIKVKNERDGDRIIQKFVCHVGSLEDIRKVVCDVH